MQHGDNSTDTTPVESPRRRRVLAGIGVGAGAAALGVGTAAADSHDVTVTLNNVGARAWEVTDVEGGEIAPTGTDNPTLTLTEGVRYRVVNNGWSAHPFELRDANTDPLLSQGADGSFEGDSETNWVDDGTELAFTVTSELADELDSYICTVHSSMVGSVETTRQLDPDAATVSFSDQSTTGGSVVVDSVELGDGGFVVIHDSSLLDGEVAASVIGNSEYLEPGSYDDLTVRLDEPIEEGDTLIAMAHQDTNGNQTYDFPDADGPYTEDGGPVIDDADVQVEAAEGTLTFSNQATASSTFTSGDPTGPSVVVSGVSANTDSAVVVTYEEEGAYGDGSLVIAGLNTFSADALDGADVDVPVANVDGFPGEHVAHVIPIDDLSGEYAPGDTVSSETAEAVLANDAATVFQGTLTFEDQTADDPVEEGDVMATVDATLAGGDDTAFDVEVHPTDGDGVIVGTEWVGSTDVLAGENEGAEITAERVPEDGEFNELPFEGSDEFVAMIHVVNDGAAPGDAASPGNYPVLPNAGGDGFVPGGVTDQATVTAGDADAGAGDDGTDTGDDGDDSADDDGSGPGFGVGGAVAALSGLGYAIRRRLDGTDEQ